MDTIKLTSINPAATKIHDSLEMILELNIFISKNISEVLNELSYRHQYTQHELVLSPNCIIIYDIGFLMETCASKTGVASLDITPPIKHHGRY